MKKIFLTSVAIFPLLAVGLLPASSQDARQKQGPGMSQGQSPGAGGAQQKRGQSQMRGAQSQSQGAAKGPGAQEGTEGRAQPGQAGNERSAGQGPGNERSVGQAGPNNRERGKSATQPRGAQGQPKAGANPTQTTTGQSQRNQQNAGPNQQPSRNAAGQPKQKQQQPSTTGQNQRQQPNTTGQNRQPQPSTTGQNRQPQQNATPPNQQTGQTTSRGQTGGARGNVTLTEDQRTKIQQTVLSGRDVPRENRVDFSVSVGAEVPRRVRVVRVPTVLIDIHPEWRDDEYFVARDEIYIVDRSRRIIATVPVGSSRSSVGTGSTTASFESPEEIREVQQVLIEKGFFHGRVDGIMGRETRQALISFQRSQGLEASGRIDERTVSSLGISGRTQGQGAGQGTQGQGPGQGQQGNMPRQNNQNAGQNPPAQKNPGATTGQGGNQPSANPNAGPNNQGANQGQGQNQDPPTTSGQGGNQPKQQPQQKQQRQ